MGKKLLLLVLVAAPIVAVAYFESVADKPTAPSARVEFEEMQITPRTIAARVRNLSGDRDISRMFIAIQVADCAEGRCDTVGQTEKLLVVNIPRNQVRDVHAPIHFTGLRATPAGAFKYEYKVLDIQ